MELLKRILEEADISLQEWEQLWGEGNSSAHSYSLSLVINRFTLPANITDESFPQLYQVYLE